MAKMKKVSSSTAKKPVAKVSPMAKAAKKPAAKSATKKTHAPTSAGGGARAELVEKNIGKTTLLKKFLSAVGWYD